MEGSESESESYAIFKSLNLNPQLFFNEIFNTADDLLIETFDFIFREASTKLNVEASQKSQHLKQGIDHIRQNVQSVADQKLSVWEEYCLYHCFSLPKGFQMPNTDELGGNDIDLVATSHEELDAELESLREKLAEVGKESEMLNQEIEALPKHSSLNALHINEAVQLLEQNSELFQEVLTTARELRLKIGKQNTNMIEETEEMKARSFNNYTMDTSAKGLSNMKLEDLQRFVTQLE
ncbi:protein MIS12 homolog [Vicia villosa]|uniref:protein MIS12 homolog n=1 Tax=Vicia villosa TaxID=3911 RepID=UPI00273B6307|nr:protein MIS12 homolog [Vicia villosa]XP_058732900.1 protein MIS12 homolog [Vicia villosa]